MALTAAQDKEEEEEEGGGGGDTEKEEYFPRVFDFFLLRYSGSFVGTTPPGRSMRFRSILRRLLGLIWLRRRMVGRPGGKGGKQGIFLAAEKILFRGMSLPGGYTDYNPLEGIGSNQHLAASLFLPF